MVKKMDIGDRELLDGLFDSYSLELYKIARHRTNDEEKAKEAVQMVFTIAAAKVAVVRAHGNKKLWLYATLQNVIKQLLYDGKYTKEGLIREVVDEVEEDLVWDTYDFEDKGLIEDIKPYLKEREYKYLVERFVNERTNQEIADILGMNYSTVTSLGNRVLKKIKKILEKRDKNGMKFDI